MENLDPPFPPKSRMRKWRVFALRAPSSLIWGGDGGLLFHFILSKIVGTSSRICRNLIYYNTQHEGPPVRDPLFHFCAGNGLFFSSKIFSDLIRAVAILFCTKFTDFSDNIDLQEFFRPFGLFGLGLCNGWPRKVSPR